ncbi:23S rRNA (adenine(2503)-C(2))-methyltransferase RlmN [Chitinispirillales bacterium ANBcel5]|uniref:23S rRNA (adenine(2503)-C(2))-methyltransferase RlmN n=1 Tax=Cellulosispirillum alkaliphilum TaxID=3039283 RepID=UPI002A5528A3|nr:23S rRNA (adenine(2503)-C(2))-methyltransferase RlmN [Chitinispirillales bacterium ANBcel5]
METTASKTDLRDLSINELEQFILSLGEKKFRARQIYKWLYQKRVDDFEQMSNMSKHVRQQLSACCSIQKPEPKYILESKYGDAVKFGFAFNNTSYIIESVLLFDDKRRTACVSSQIGCALGCSFCETAKLGFIRNLTQQEILAQLIGINDYLCSKSDKLVTNVVFMGMGEALSNFANFRKALEVIMHEDGFNLGGRRITVSTAGVIPSIERLINENLNVGLAISLNAWNDKLRDEVMPINKKYNIAQLVKIAKRYFEKTGRRVTFEYVVIDGITNTPGAKKSLSKLLSGFPCKINLIPLNTAGDIKENTVSEDKVLQFSQELHKLGLAATVRKSRGRDIMGACGQLTAYDATTV